MIAKIPYFLEEEWTVYAFSTNRMISSCVKIRVRFKQLFYQWLDDNTEFSKQKYHTKISVRYKWFPSPNKHGNIHDRNNVLSAVDKYLMDYLVDRGCIEDDSIEYVWDTNFSTWELVQEGYVLVDIEQELQW